MSVRIALFALLGAICIFGLAKGATRKSTESGQIVREVIATGGGQMINSQRATMVGTVGQPIARVSISENGTRIIHGVHQPAKRGAESKNWRVYE